MLFGALYKIRRRAGSRFVKIHKSTRTGSGWTYTRISHGVDIATRGEGGDGTVGAGGGELANRFAAAVTRDKHAGRPGAAILAGGGVARGVKLHEVGENGVIRLMPDGDEQPVKAYLAPPAGMAHGDAAQLRIAKQLFDRGVEDELDVILGFERLYELFFAAEAAAAVDKIDLAAGSRSGA